MRIETYYANNDIYAVKELTHAEQMEQEGQMTIWELFDEIDHHDFLKDKGVSHR